jgi:hypothetical protein
MERHRGELWLSWILVDSRTEMRRYVETIAIEAV